MAQMEDPPDLTGRERLVFCEQNECHPQYMSHDASDNRFNCVSSVGTPVEDDDLSVKDENPLSVLTNHSKCLTSASQSGDTVFSDKERRLSNPSGDLECSRHSDADGDVTIAMSSSCVPNFDLISADSDFSDFGGDTEEFVIDISTEVPDITTVESAITEQEPDISVLGIKGRLGSTSSTCSTNDGDGSSATPIPFPGTAEECKDIPARYIPDFVRSISGYSFSQRPFMTPLSTIGSTAPKEFFSTDLVEDGIPFSRQPQRISHNVRRGSVYDLDEFVDKQVYRADPNTGILISEKLNPRQIENEWFYREGEEYTVLQENHPSICICQDSLSQEKFVRKQRKRSKFEGQKKSVLVPLKHSESPHIMDIYGLIVLMDDVYIFMEYCEGGCLTHTKPRSVQETFECVERILETISYIHSHGLVHGDIKPENICLRSPDDLTSLCLIDFEFVRTPETQPQFRGYTTQFLPPWWPKLKNCSRVCYAELRSMDLWATACIAVCLLTGKRPWSVQVKEYKKYCTNCPPGGCTCQLLHKLQQHIIDHGDNLLEKHLDRETIQSTSQGKSLWKTLTFLTTNDNMCESKAKEALNKLNDEEEEEMIIVEIHYKNRVIYETVVQPGTSVQELLNRPNIKNQLDNQVKKWMLFLPSPDHKITSACVITVQKQKTHLVERLVKKLKIGR